MGSQELPQDRPDGERWLELIGYDHLKDQETGHYIEGQPVMVGEFNRLCDSHVRPMFTALEMLENARRNGVEDPRLEKYRAIARTTFEAYFPSAKPDA